MNDPTIRNDQAPADEKPPPSIDEMKAAIKANRDRVASDLAAARRRRDRENANIRALVMKLAEAERLVKALEPRKAKKS